MHHSLENIHCHALICIHRPVILITSIGRLAKRFRISDGALRRFACNIRLSYHQNPFHNFLHGFSVFQVRTQLLILLVLVNFSSFYLRFLFGRFLQVTYLLIKEAGLSNFLSDADLLAALTGALCHDVDHPGVRQLKIP